MTIDPKHVDPENDPYACSICGTCVGQWREHCESCARDYGDKPPIQECYACGQYGGQETMTPIDVSAPDEYYPDVRYLCRNCQGGESA